MKIVSSGKALHSPEFYNKKEKARRLKLKVFAVLVVAVLAGLVLVLRYEGLLISEVSVVGASAVKSEEVSRYIEKALEGEYLWLLPRRSAALYWRADLEKRLPKEIPRIKAADLSLVDARSLEVSIVEREPHALYCLDISDLSSPSGCYFLDDGGFIFALAPFFSGDVYFIYSQAKPMASPIGRDFLASEEFRAVSELISGMSEFDIRPRALKSEVSGSGRVKYNLILPNMGKIMWYADQSPALVRANLEALLLSSTVTDRDRFLDDILYIDLTIDHKVFFKFKN